VSGAGASAGAVHFTLEGGVAADVADAETAVTRLNAQAPSLADTEALARLLLHAESVASARIEGLEIGARRLLRAEVAKDLGEPTHANGAPSWAESARTPRPIPY